MDHVAGVKELRDRSVDVFLRFIKCIRTVRKFGFVLVVKDQVFASIRPVIVEPVASAFPVFVCEDLCLC